MTTTWKFAPYTHHLWLPSSAISTSSYHLWLTCRQVPCIASLTNVASHWFDRHSHMWNSSAETRCTVLLNEMQSSESSTPCRALCSHGPANTGSFTRTGRKPDSFDRISLSSAVVVLLQVVVEFALVLSSLLTPRLCHNWLPCTVTV